MRPCRVAYMMAFLAVLPALAIAGGQQEPRTGQAAQPAKNSAPYPTATGTALDVKESVVKEENDHTVLRVEFNGIRGDRVPSFMYVPRNQARTKAPYPAILLQHGIGTDRTNKHIVAIAQQFAARGFVVLTIDAPDAGERRPRKDKEKKPSALLGLFGGDQVMHHCGDCSRATDLLASRAEVDRDRLGFVGVSWGAITGITYVAHEPRVKAMASLLGGGNFLGLVSTEQALKSANESIKLGDPIYHVARIAPRPLLFVNATKDVIIQRPWAESLHKAAPAAKVIWLDTNHNFGPNPAEVCTQVIDFMAAGLPAQPQVKAKE